MERSVVEGEEDLLPVEVGGRHRVHEDFRAPWGARGRGGRVCCASPGAERRGRGKAAERSRETRNVSVAPQIPVRRIFAFSTTRRAISASAAVCT